MPAVGADGVLAGLAHSSVKPQVDDGRADRRFTNVGRGRPARLRARRAHHGSVHTLDRRKYPGSARLQMEALAGPHAPLPPFGRRAKDIRPLSRYQLAFRRALDVSVASITLVSVAPMMLLISVLIKCTSRGPVLFRHQRVGLGGRTIEVIKFRSMKVGTEQDLRTSEKDRLDYIRNDFKLSATDPRITRIGLVLRRSSLDELPQLINVLKGDMSIVGVRPLVQEELLMRPFIDQMLYCRLRPGITGLWQTSGRSSVLHNKRIAMDRAYVAEWHALWDVRILVQTPRSVLRAGDAA